MAKGVDVGSPAGGAVGGMIGFGVGGFAIGSIDGIAAGVVRARRNGRKYATGFIQDALFLMDYQSATLLSLVEDTLGLTPEQVIAVRGGINAYTTGNLTRFVGSDRWWPGHQSIITSFVKSGAISGFVAGTAAGGVIGTDIGAIYGTAAGTMTGAAAGAALGKAPDEEGGRRGRKKRKMLA